MEYRDIGFILGFKDFSNNQRIAFLLTEKNGLWKGMLNKSTLNIGDKVSFTWSAKTPDNLGRFNYDYLTSNFIFNYTKPEILFMLKSISELCINLLPERQECNKLYSFLNDNFKNITYQGYIIFELKLLESLGYGLDLFRCAVTGEIGNTFYLSPKTGRAVKKEIGEKYKDKLFKIPKFLLSSQTTINKDELIQALDINEYFFKKNILDIGSAKFFRDKIKQKIIG